MPISGSYFYPGLNNPISSYPSFVLRNGGNAPRTLDGHGQVYVLSPSNDLYFKDSDGIEYQITPPQSVGGIVNYIGGDSLSARDAVFIASDGKVYKTSVFSISSSFAIGFSLLDSLSGETVQIDEEQGKILNNFSGLTAGARYYLSGSNGKISTEVPVDKNTIVYQVGIAKSSTDLLFYPRFVMIL